jgi:hypothetical protein
MQQLLFHLLRLLRYVCARRARAAHFYPVEALKEQKTAAAVVAAAAVFVPVV